VSSLAFWGVPITGAVVVDILQIPLSVYDFVAFNTQNRTVWASLDGML